LAEEFDILNLLRLQIVESMISSRIHKLESLVKNEELIKLNKEYNQVKEELDKISNDYSNLEASRKKLEDKVQINREKIKANQKKLFSGTIGSSKELVNYQEEIRLLESQNSKMEDEEIELMLQIEEMDEDLKKARDRVGQLEEKVNKIKGNIAEQAKEIETQIENLKKKRKDIVSTIPSDQLERYDKVKQKKGGIAVTVLKDNFCSGCNMEIPTVEAEKIKDPDQIYRCPLCGRLSVIYTDQVDKIKQEMDI